jgi:hypothetical protein
MKLQDIKDAVLAGRTVHWKNAGYRVIYAPKLNDFLIRFDYNGDCIGLTWTNGVTMNGEEKDFFLSEEVSL